MYSKVILNFLIIGLGAVWTGPQTSGAAAIGDVTLLGTLEEWKYLGSNFGGASMSDGGNPRLQSVKAQAILTTGDSVEKVVKFYSEKLGTLPASGPRDAKADAKVADAKSVSIQDDSQGRPVKVQVIVVNRAETSTTLVISRADGETQTHIAWSHYLRLGGNR